MLYREPLSADNMNFYDNIQVEGFSNLYSEAKI